jgi:hypothetical protein
MKTENALAFLRIYHSAWLFSFKELNEWGEVDSNHRSHKTTDLQSVPFGHSGISPPPRADGGTRTPDQLITNQLLYQLSYIGIFILPVFQRLKNPFSHRYFGKMTANI